MAAASAFALTYASHKFKDGVILQGLDSTGLAAPAHEPGYTIRDTDGREWQYVLFDTGGTACVAGGPAFWAQTTTNSCVTTVNTQTGLTGEAFAGVFMSVLTDTYYGWIQIRGKTMVNCSTVAVGSAVGPIVTEGYFEAATPGTHTIAGYTMEATTANGFSFPYVNLIDNSS